MPDCTTDKDPCDVLPRAGETWSVCLPFGGRIWSDGNGVHANGGIAPPDGVYGKVIIADGCLIGVEPEDVPLYTGSPCAPLPNGCGGDSGSGGVLGGGFTPGSGSSVTCEIEAGSGVTVTGSGTMSDPYVISADSGIFLRSSNSAISVTGTGTRQNPFTLAHKEGLATTINGMTFDAFGHLTSANGEGTSSSSGIPGIVPGDGIQVTPNFGTGIPTVGLQPQPSDVPGTYALGGYDVRVNSTGQISSVQPRVTIPNAPVTIACGTADVKVDEHGSVVSIGETFDLGCAYVISWPHVAAEDSARHTARFTLRHSTALAGICIGQKPLPEEMLFYLDGQRCNTVGNLFYNSSVFGVGQHTLEVSTAISDNTLAILLIAANGMDRNYSG